MHIVSVTARAWTLPLRAPFAIARRTAHEALNVLIRIETETPGVSGIGESAPVSYVTGESVESVLVALNAVGPRLEGQPLERLEPLLALVRESLPEAPAARAGLEMALYDAWARRWNLPLWQFFGGAQTALESDLTIPIVPPDRAEWLVREAVAEGFRCFKIKVGDSQGHEADLARVEAIARAAPGAHLRIDANQAFTPDEAVAFARHLSRLSLALDLLEQPVAKEDLAGLKYVRASVSIPVFADEAARDVPSVLKLLETDAVDGINVKLMKCGLTQAVQIASLCRIFGKRLMLGCMLESRLGIAAAAQMAGGLGCYDFLDLDSHRLLAPLGHLTGGFEADGGDLALTGHGPGWGVTLDPEPPR